METEDTSGNIEELWNEEELEDKEKKMIKPKTIKKSQAKHILQLIEQSTRAEVMARLGSFQFPEYANYHMVAIEKRNELLEYIYGTSCFVTLGRRWKLIKRSGKVKRGKSKKNKKSLT